MEVDILLLNRSEQKTTSKELVARLKKAYPSAGVTVRRHPMFLRAAKDRMSRLKYQLYRIRGRIGSLFMQDARISNHDECPGNFRAAIRQQIKSKSYDVYFSNYIKVTPSCVKRFKGLKVADLHDVQTRRIQNDVLPTLPRWKRGLYERLFRASEIAAMRRFDRLIAISPLEKEIIEKDFCPGKQVSFLPITFDTPRQVKSVAAPYHDLLLVGSNSDANVHAVEWFLQEVFPLIVEAVPHVRLLIQGAVVRNHRVKEHPTTHYYQYTNIFLKDFRQNLAEIYSDAKIVLCPIRKGTGMKVKVIEALAYGKPVVGTSVAFEGIEAVDGRHARIADDAGAFASAVVGLLGDPTRSLAIGTAAHMLFREKYHFRRLLSDITDVIPPSLSEHKASQVRGRLRLTAGAATDRAEARSDIVELLKRYGRYGYRRITALVRDAVWSVGRKREERV
jgi:glycosyltransferase involved in cell wall biosynthesis